MTEADARVERPFPSFNPSVSFFQSRTKRTFAKSNKVERSTSIKEELKVTENCGIFKQQRSRFGKYFNYSNAKRVP